MSSKGFFTDLSISHQSLGVASTVLDKDVIK